MIQGYPRVEINLKYIEENTRAIVERCSKYGVNVSGVIKGVNGIPQVSKAYADGGADMICSSRLEQIEEARAYGVDKPMMLIRIPMLTKVEETVRVADYSLNSEMEVIEALNEEAGRQGKVHNVVLMVDLGDLREGWWDQDELCDAAWRIENELDNIYLAGVGVNVGCYGAVMPTAEKLQELVDAAEKVEARIGRRLDIISGGGSSSLMRIWDGDIPERINHLRIGGEIVAAFTNEVVYGYDMSCLHKDAIRLKAEIIEIKDKPTYPVGTIARDDLGKYHTYEDRGIRRRALIAVGRLDYHDPEDLIPVDKNIQVLGANGDYTILDVEDCDIDYKVGDIIEFVVRYGTMVYLTKSRNVKEVFI